jgi:hypothetical protein
MTGEIKTYLNEKGTPLEKIFEKDILVFANGRKGKVLDIVPLFREIYTEEVILKKDGKFYAVKVVYEGTSGINKNSKGRIYESKELKIESGKPFPVADIGTPGDYK